MEELAASFQALCNLWHEKVPGILAASVHREPEAPAKQQDDGGFLARVRGAGKRLVG